MSKSEVTVSYEDPRLDEMARKAGCTKDEIVARLERIAGRFKKTTRG